MGSILGQNCVIAKMLKIVPTMLYQISQNDSISIVEIPWPKNRLNLLPCTDCWDFETKTVQSKGWLSAQLEHLDLLKGLALDCYQPTPEV